ncbi:MAG: hypothetical protein ACRD12_11310 [Acidimicrobiales bacterium]
MQFGDGRLEPFDRLALSLDHPLLRLDHFRLPGGDRFELGYAALVVLGRVRVACHVQTFATTPRDSCSHR